MQFNLFNQIGDRNPQLLRELKGRLQPRNILLAIAISVFGQFLLFTNFQIQLPISDLISNGFTHKYCTGAEKYGYYTCLRDAFDHVIINWELWAQDIFISLSSIVCFTLLVAGCYLLISDLANEQKRGTLNFIRLSPQSSQSILLGKILGVPILLYLVIILTIPLHLWSGLAANIPLVSIFTFYAVLGITSVFYYSAALLFGLVGSWLGGFQPWLGSGVVLVFISVTHNLFFQEIPNEYPLVILRLFNPANLIPQVKFGFDNFHWFAFPVGENFFTIMGFSLLVNMLGIYGIWQSLQRCFIDSHANILSKRQSYLLTSGFVFITIGCANWQKLVWENSPTKYLLSENIACLLFLYFGLFLYLIAALNPHRQTLQDWARYRRIYAAQKHGYGSLIQDLIWSEKSPGLLAIAINMMIPLLALSLLTLLSHVSFTQKLSIIPTLVLGASLIILYAALTQLVLLIKNQNRVFWAAGVVSAAIILPLIIAAMFYSYSSNNSFLWLFSIVAPISVMSPEGKSLSAMTLLTAIFSYWTVSGLLIFQLTRRLRKIGESATKALSSQTSHFSQKSES
ncbi:hypothetical protein [Fortiea contorta]|uniref:hypothetical protein n=1 Tax=Fortiea contorta TaxID=1892405 RepID=UPI00034857F8|nr:hypothetical protein [Fortiea contorta]